MIRAVLLFSILCVAALGQNPVTAQIAIQKAHKASHKIEMQSITGGSEGSCSGTAIGPHALLTAAHCSSASAVLTVDGKDADVMLTEGDGLDHEIYLLRGVTFTDYTEVSDTPAQQGDSVFVFGNPAGFSDLFRRGVIAGYYKDDAEGFEKFLNDVLSPKKSGNESVRITLYDFNGFFGDSGSAIYNTDGKIVAVTSFITGEAAEGYQLKFMGSYELRFSKETLAAARAYEPPAAPAVPAQPKHKSFWDLFANEQKGN